MLEQASRRTLRGLAANTRVGRTDASDMAHCMLPNWIGLEVQCPKQGRCALLGDGFAAVRGGKGGMRWR